MHVFDCGCVCKVDEKMQIEREIVEVFDWLCVHALLFSDCLHIYMSSG